MAVHPAMMSNAERLVYMANQIAQNLQSRGHDSAVAATADHIASFWDPRMKAQLFALRGGNDGLGAIAAAAIALLAVKGAPPPQSHATEFDGAADAG